MHCKLEIVIIKQLNKVICVLKLRTTWTVSGAWMKGKKEMQERRTASTDTDSAGAKGPFPVKGALWPGRLK